MEELTDQSIQIKMEDLDELSQLIWDEFGDDRNKKWEQLDVNAQGRNQSNDVQMAGTLSPVMLHRQNDTVPHGQNISTEGTCAVDIRNTEY